MRFYVLLDRVAYRVSLPFIRIFLRGTDRAYVLLVANDSALLVKNWLGDGRWALPGGGVHRHESVRSAVLRECSEELGFVPRIGTLQLVHQGVWQTGRLGCFFRIYVASIELVQPAVRGFEIVEARWIALDSLTIHTTPAEILEAVRRYHAGLGRLKK